MIGEYQQPDNLQDSEMEPLEGSEKAPEAMSSAETEVSADAEVVADAEAAEVSPAEEAQVLSVVQDLQQEIAALRSQLEERNSQCVRIAADFDNYRKRTAKEKEDLDQQARSRAITELLPVVDSFERARSQIKPQNEGEMGIHKSYQGVYKQLVESLKRLGVAPMRSEGTEFDPNLHEAVMRETTDEHPEGTVLEELVRGYMIGDRVLRHAMVKVAAAPEPVVTSEETSQNGSES
ncbi:nucleotide exchange factor GrpE [Geitlerinema sp. PCC 7407]|uniref:nucleotide exchange factor GrpE n=1 Tax=Geitlerinema sp. PCC 7407 TaxID=1173025 RepID=UPI00029F8EAA|nr:nucleotide exchange factor GrpE [Geitlerinema sp. PCC 7407]AFY64887.1 GrpE protein [Geitlerinema sp. PCC 7407]